MPEAAGVEVGGAAGARAATGVPDARPAPGSTVARTVGGRADPRAAAEARRRFGRPGLAPLWVALRDRLERAGDTPVRRVRVGPLGEAQRRAFAELLGLDRLPGTHATVAVDRLDAVVGDALPGCDARAVVEALGGPLVDRAGARDAARRARAALWAWLEHHPQVRAEPALAAWADGERRRGVIGGSPTATRELLERALAVLAALPADGRPLAAFANQACGHPHALDDDRRLSGIVLRALATLRGVPVPDDAESRRALWEQVGVACDALSATVLVAGLHAHEPAGPLAPTLSAWAEAGEACWVTLAQLRSAPPVTVGDALVWVVENPSVVAEALRRFGASCPPLVCTSGWPSGAALELLRGLEEGGARLAYHGDLDGEGVRIAAHIAGRTAAVPWGMSAADYLAHARAGGPPVGRVTDAPWDPALAPAMRDRGVAVHQEDVCADLLERMLDPTDTVAPGRRRSHT